MLFLTQRRDFLKVYELLRTIAGPADGSVATVGSPVSASVQAAVSLCNRLRHYATRLASTTTLLSDAEKRCEAIGDFVNARVVVLRELSSGARYFTHTLAAPRAPPLARRWRRGAIVVARAGELDAAAAQLGASKSDERRRLAGRLNDNGLAVHGHQRSGDFWHALAAVLWPSADASTADDLRCFLLLCYARRLVAHRGFLLPLHDSLNGNALNVLTWCDAVADGTLPVDELVLRLAAHWLSVRCRL